MKFKNIVFFIVVFLLAFSLAVPAIPADVRGHQSEKIIMELLEEKIMTPRSDGFFYPEQAVTRADLYSLAIIKGLITNQATEIPDLKGHQFESRLDALSREGIVNLYPDGTYRPAEQVSRAEMASIIIRILQLDDAEKTVNPKDLAVPSDMATNHWALDAVKISERLGIMPLYSDGSFRPNQGITRAEFATTLYALMGLTPVTSFLQEIYPASHKITLQSMENKQKIFAINNNALLGRNNRLVEITELKRSDKVYLLLDRDEKIVYLKAYGLMTKDDLSTEISYLTNDLLTGDDISALMAGDYSVLRPVVGKEVSEQLQKQGFSDKEIYSLMAQDWDTLEDLGRERLSEVLSMETGLPLDITRALIRQDWDLLQELTKAEIMQRIIQRVLDLDIFNS